MTLSIKKLHAIINSKGLVPVKHYILDKYYYVIETISVKNGETVLVWIPEKYRFKCDKESEVVSEYAHYKLKRINIGLSQNIVDKYGNQVDMEKYYPELDIDESIAESNKDVEDALIENYQHPITLDNFSKDELDDVRDIYRQLSRLKYCVKYISYKLTIMVNNYFCITNDKNEIDCYYIKRYVRKDSMKRLYVLISLESLITSDHNFESDVKDVQTGVRKLIDRNQTIHTNKLSRFLDRKDEIHRGIKSLENLKNRGDQMIKEYEKLLKHVDIAEKSILDKLENVKGQDNMSGNIYKDIEKNTLLKTTEEELAKNTYKKDKIREKLLELEDYISDVVLKADQILFDNIVLLKTIHSNIDKLHNIFS